MKLLLDIGNSRLKWLALPALDAPLPVAQAIPHTGDMAAAVATLAAEWRGAAPQAIYIAHVMGDAHEHALTAALHTHFGMVPRYARSAAECVGLRSAYADAARLGVDRWLAMLAVWARTRQAFCVANAGTALTFDAVDGSGQHQGGVIAPGLQTMIDATLGRTRFAVGAMAAEFENGLGRDTEACVRLGALHAATGLLERLAARHEGARVLAGGDAATLAVHLDAGWQLAPNLVLQGLAVWAQQAV